MATNLIDYRLPVTVARLNSTVVWTRFDGGSAKPTTTSDLSVATASDTRFALNAEVKGGLLLDLDATLSLTSDLRLTSASSESTGTLGKVIATAIKIGVAAAAIAAFGGEPTPQGRYATEQQEAAARLVSIRTAIGRASAAIAVLLSESLEGSRSPVLTLMPRIQGLRAIRTLLEEELATELKIRDAWIASRTTTWTETAVDEVNFDELPPSSWVKQDRLEIPTPAASLRQLWGRLGVMITVDDLRPGVPDQGSSLDVTRRDGIWMRIPRPVRWTLWRSKSFDVGGPEPTVDDVKTGIAWVVDKKCELKFVAFRRSLFAKRKIAMEFGESGSLSKFTATHGSTLAAVATAAGDSLSAYSDGLTSAQTIRTTRATLADDAEVQELADLNRRYQIREAELKQSGLDATAADYAELEYLKQQALVVQQRGLLDPRVLATDAITKDTALYQAAQSAARREEQANYDLANLRDMIEALKT
jgi:hypothetical protein